MNRIKSTALTILGIIAALTAFGFFASVGLAVIGALVVLGVVATVAAGIASLFAKREDEDAAVNATV